MSGVAEAKPFLLAAFVIVSLALMLLVGIAVRWIRSDAGWVRVAFGLLAAAALGTITLYAVRGRDVPEPVLEMENAADRADAADPAAVPEPTDPNRADTAAPRPVEPAPPGDASLPSTAQRAVPSPSPTPLSPTPPPIVQVYVPPAAAGPAQAQPRGDPAAWITADDYPAAALRQERTGVTTVAATIGVDGRLADCTVTTSSGSPDLDETTCRVLTYRARFTPARDAGGNPVPDRFTRRVRWSLPRD